jgi:hypothetical protein
MIDYGEREGIEGFDCVKRTNSTAEELAQNKRK